MSKYMTMVLRMPESSEERAKVQEALKLLEPYRTGMSLEDEMTVLEFIEQHEDLPLHISQEARAKALELHTQIEKEHLSF